MLFLPILLCIIPILFFGITSALYSFQADKLKKELRKYKNYESRIDLNTLLDHVMRSESVFSFDIYHVMSVIKDQLDIKLPYTVLSILYVSQNKPYLETIIKQQIGNNFSRIMKDSIIASYNELSGGNIEQIDEKLQGFTPNDALGLPASIFHVPLFINGRVVSMLTLASANNNQYALSEMLTLYNLANIMSKIFSGIKKELLHEKKKIFDMLGALSDGVILFDTNLNVLTANKAIRDFLGLTQEIPSNEDIFSHIPTSEHLLVKLHEVINTNIEYEEYDIQIKDKIFNLFIKPVVEADSRSIKINGASLVLHNATQEKSISQMKQDFTNIMVHELRSPLTSIKASTQLLTSEANLTPEEQHKLIVLISTQANRLLDEVARILDAAKLEAGLFTVQKIPGDLGKIINEKMELFNAQAQERFIKLNMQIDPTIPVFSFDPIHIGQVINNLLSNSMKFTSTGGTISLSAKNEAGKIIVSVSDTGCGIPKDKQHLLFSKFSQISTPGSHVGTGLGLYITKGIIQAHGGTIILNSQEGKGTTITFSLPVELNVKATESEPSGTSPLTSAPKNLVN